MKKLYPYQESLISAILAGKKISFDFNSARAQERKHRNDIFTCSKLLLSKKGEKFCICTPNGNVTFQCIENTIK